MADWAKTHMGLELMSWQLHALTGQLAFDGLGELQFRESLVSVARQNGKTQGGIVPLIGWWLTDFAELRGAAQSVLSTANRLDLAESIFTFLAPILVERFGAKAMNALGRKSIVLPNKSRWEVRAATASLHGGSHDLIVVDELWNIAPQVLDEALRPSQIARKSPLLSSWSTAGDESSICMQQHREQAIVEIDRKETSKLYFAEWSIGGNPQDERNWVQANPALGTTITLDALRAVSKKDSFLRAHLNLWVSARGSWLEAGLWDSHCVGESMPPGGVLTVDSSVDDSRYVGVRSIVVDGKCQICVEFVVNTEDEMWEEIARVMVDTSVQLAITPSLDLHTPTILRRRTSTVGYGELLKYTGLVQKMIMEGKVKHRGELSLAEHMNRACLIKSGQGVSLSSAKSPGPIELARCAVWGIALSSKYQNRAKPMIVVG